MLEGDGWAVEVRGDELANLTFDHVLLLRAVRPVVRDQDWNTVAVRVSRFAQVEDGATLSLEFSDGHVHFSADLVVRMSPDRLDIQFRAVAEQTCSTNRVGLVVLHPAAHAGTPVNVIHSDGSRQQAVWPADISPHQPFMTVSGFDWTVDGVDAELRLSGDVFETEDQRNWTDASFKTYSTPLSQPFPVHNAVGDVVNQTATLSAHRTGRSTLRLDEPDLVVVDENVVGQLPPLSVGAALFPAPTIPGDLPAGLTPGAFESVLVELTGRSDAWVDNLTLAAGQARALGCGLDVRVSSNDAAAVADLADALPPETLRLAVFDPASHLSDKHAGVILRQAVHQLERPIEVVGGTRAHFTELNRGRKSLADDADTWTFSLTPQMHASEIAHIIDSLPMQRLVLANAARLVGGQTLHVGPITLARRFNAVATSGAVTPEVAAAQGTDELLHTDFAAAWTLGSLASLTRPDPSETASETARDRPVQLGSVCYFETTGPRGLAVDGQLTPVGQLLDRFAQRRGWAVVETRSPDRLSALAVRSPRGSLEASVGDLSGQRRSVRLRHRSGGADRILELAAWQTTHLVINDLR